MEAENIIIPSLTKDALIQEKLCSLAKENNRFLDFIGNNKNKIKGKFKDSTTREDSLDVYVELETAHILFKEFSDQIKFLEYEKSDRGPDFNVTSNADYKFNVEVKRIREWDTQICFEEFTRKLREKVIIKDIGINLSVDLIGRPSTETATLIKQLCAEDSLNRIIEYLRIKKDESDRIQRPARMVDAPGCKKIITFQMILPKNPDGLKNIVMWGFFSSGTFPEGTKKIRNDILDKLDKQHQFPISIPNILVLRTWNMYIMGEEFVDVLEMFATEANFKERIKDLSAILYRGPYTEWSFWENENCTTKLPDEVKKQFISRTTNPN